MPIESLGTLLRQASENKEFAVVEYTGETTLREYAYDQISRWIELGVLEGGTYVSELGIAKELNISRVPVREAAMRLQAEGLLISVPRGGYRVKKYTIDEVLQFYELREIVEAKAAGLAARRASGLDLIMIKELHEQFKQCRLQFDFDQNYDFYCHAMSIELDNKFHLNILKASKNIYFAKMLPALNSRFVALSFAMVYNDRKGYSYFAENDRTIEIHAEIVDALLERDAHRAEQTASHHVRNVISNILQFKRERV